MLRAQPPLERAFELARSGTVSNIADIERRLIREGFKFNELAGPVLRRQLRELICEARPYKLRTLRREEESA